MRKKSFLLKLAVLSCFFLSKALSSFIWGNAGIWADKHNPFDETVALFIDKKISENR